jgi:hypothetical protein
VSATFREVDETVERELFERRARALGPGDGVPSLDAVLRAASESASAAVPPPAVREEWRDRSGARARAWSGLALAAACVVAVMRTSPPASAPSAIAPDGPIHTEVAAPGDPPMEATCEESEVNACTNDPALASVAPPPPVVVAPPHEEETCGDKAMTPRNPSPSMLLTCDQDDPARSEIP